ncbi:response regulator [Occallatibacter riparius]|uniref:Response regulator transcription factor n=1 Tax=Occallatibacter riparius TaxID=1002689 RepID=A0A9J7BY13_9BACT|nr:response regulator transcription factor [Occallatibacter riparius]UWZ86938.1 response regulator transcription factor [Occallatibacter riparius]
MRKRLLLGDDHSLMLDGLSRLLSTEFDVVGTATTGRELIAEADRLQPDVVVLDIGMPEMNGIEAARRLAKTHPGMRLIFVTQQLDPAYVHAAFATGARAYVAKQSAAKELMEAIRMALADRYYVSPLVGGEAGEIARAEPRRNPAELFQTKLTPRQREVLQLVAEGKSTKEISTCLNISIKTVEFHRSSLMDELGLRTIAELTRYAIAQGIVNQ